MTKTFFINADWKRWIAENVLLGGKPEDLTRILVSHGFGEELSRLEVDVACNHPYLFAGQSIVKQLQKRDWVLHNSRILRETSDHAIDEVSNAIEPVTFFRTYYATNRPLIIRNGARNWPAVQLWNENYLIAKAGHREVQIQNCRNSDPKYEINASKLRSLSLFSDFVSRVFHESNTNDFYMTAQNGDINRVALEPLWPDLHPVPDMLEEQSRHRMFFWMGPAGTVTPLHHDNTNNLMIQVVGRKCVKVIAPDYLPYLYNHYHCYSGVDVENVDLAKFPLFARVKVHEVTIGPADILFLPVGWWHHVRGLDPTITITATNFRGITNQFNEFYPKV